MVRYFHSIQTGKKVQTFVLRWTIFEKRFIQTIKSPPPNTKAHFLEQKYFTYKRILYESKYLEDCLHSCFDTSGKKLT